MINYGIVYGLSDYGLADRLQHPARGGQGVHRRLPRALPARSRVHAEDDRAGRASTGYVTTLFGRRRQIPELRARNWQVRTLGERLAVNTVIQGTAADVIKLAMVRCHRALADAGLATRLILPIHDELLFEGPAGGGRARRASSSSREMVGAAERDPPLAVDAGVGPNWLEAK